MPAFNISIGSTAPKELQRLVTTLQPPCNHLVTASQRADCRINGRSSRRN